MLLKLLSLFATEKAQECLMLFAELGTELASHDFFAGKDDA